jgi:hypothetical protein
MSGSRWGNSQYFNPRQFGSCALWLDGKDPRANGTLPPNGSLNSWTDKSPQGYVAVQASAGQQPVYEVASGSLQWTQSNATAMTIANFSAGSNISVYSVLTPVVIGGGVGFNIIELGLPNAFVSNGFDLNNQACEIKNNGNAFFQVDPGFGWIDYAVTKVASFVYDGTTMTLYLNNVSQGTNATSTSNVTVTDTLNLGSRANGASQTYPGSGSATLQSFIIYNTPLTIQQQAILYNYLKNKWGVS